MVEIDLRRVALGVGMVYVRMKRYLRIWLLFVALVHVVIGCMTFFGEPAGLLANYVDALFERFNVNAPDPRAAALVEIIVRLFGATIASWGILMGCCIMQMNDATAGKYKLIFALAVLLWFFMDTGLSLSVGIWEHSVVNIFATLSLLLPMVVWWRRETKEAML